MNITVYLETGYSTFKDVATLVLDSTSKIARDTLMFSAHYLATQSDDNMSSWSSGILLHSLPAKLGLAM